jgi:hypothetical protein
MTVAPVSSPAQHPVPESNPADQRERAARHSHGERSAREPERPAFRRIAVLASVPGLSRAD